MTLTKYVLRTEVEDHKLTKTVKPLLLTAEQLVWPATVRFF